MIYRFIYEFSGLFVIATSWLFLLLPFVFLKKRYETISHAGLSSKWAVYINTGVVFAGIFQILFSIYLFQGLQNNFLGIVFLGIGGLLFVLAGFLNKKRTFKIHSLIIKIYSIATISAIFIISLFLNKLLLVVSLALILGSLILYITKKYFVSEIWTISLLSLWTILLYLLVL